MGSWSKRNFSMQVFFILLNLCTVMGYAGRSIIEDALKQHELDKLFDRNIEPSTNISNEIRNVTIMYRIKSLFSLIPTRVAISDEEAMFKKAILEEELERKEKELEGEEKCPIKPMPPKLKSGLKRYVNKTFQDGDEKFLLQNSHHLKIGNIRNRRHNGASKLLRSYQNVAASNERCNSKDYRSFTCSPNVEIERLGARYYPNHVIQTKCSECNKCMYGTGRCKQRSINIILYYDRYDDGIENLYKWEEKKHTVYTGCRCLVTSDKTMIKILDHFCRQLGGDPDSDPINCFRSHDNQLQTINKERWQTVP